MLKNVKYMFTTHTIDEMPKDNIPEIVIVGKSNVGKSTLINSLTNNSKLAHVSSKPGKTRALSLFDINGKARLVDIPGYGYAKVSKKQLEAFGQMIDSYLTKRENIDHAILLLDMRRGITEDDRVMLDYFVHNNISFTIIGTKLDKCNQKEVSAFNKQIKEELSTKVINYSAVSKKGLDQILMMFEKYQ